MRVTSLTASLVGAVTEVRLMYPSPSLDPVKLLLGRAAARPATERRPSEDTLALWLLTGSTSVTSDPAALAPTGSKRATTATAARMSMLSRTVGARPPGCKCRIELPSFPGEPKHEATSHPCRGKDCLVVATHRSCRQAP